jgi:DNA mismatch repair protein MutH
MNKPASSDELLCKARTLAGLTLAELAELLDYQLPPNLLKDKGTIGQLLERYLGASAGSKAEPDFPELGIELKTLPIDALGQPLESTYVCVAPMQLGGIQRWQDSWVCQKLSHVLWIPILASRHIPLPERIIGRAFLWQPSAAQQALLRQDWEELMELLMTGRLAEIRGAHGEVLQLRPKGANSKAVTTAVGSEGQPVLALPRGFYLKTAFTRQILQEQGYC